MTSINYFLIWFNNPFNDDCVYGYVIQTNVIKWRLIWSNDDQTVYYHDCQIQVIKDKVQETLCLGKAKTERCCCGIV